MNKKKLLPLIAVIALVALAGCSGFGSENEGKELSKETGENITEGQASYDFEIGITESNQLGLVRAQPPFTMDSSLERANLIRRYRYLNDENNVHHVYMLSNDGKVINYEVAQGKVSSVNSKLTNNRQIVKSHDCIETTRSDAEGGCFETVESPQMDGSYGENGDAIFFFTTDGHYVEYNGIYVVSEEPKNIQTAMSLVDIEDGEGNNVTSGE